MRCSICKRETVYEGNQFRPFCSERCKLIDLHNWLSGRYRVSTPVTGQEAVEPEGKGGSDLGKHDLTSGD